MTTEQKLNECAISLFGKIYENLNRKDRDVAFKLYLKLYATKIIYTKK